MDTEVDGNSGSFWETEKQPGWEMEKGETGMDWNWKKKRKEKKVLENAVNLEGEGGQH